MTALPIMPVDCQYAFFLCAASDVNLHVNLHLPITATRVCIPEQHNEKKSYLFQCR